MELKITRSSFTAIVIFMLVVLVSCSPARHIGEGQYLITKNTVKVEGDKSGIATDELTALAQPKPNKKFLGVLPVKVGLYHMGTKGKADSRFRKWLREKAGERPSLFDSSLAMTSALDMQQYLGKTGFFHSNVSFTANHYGNKKVRVEYLVHPARPYIVRNVLYLIRDSVMASFIQKDSTESKIKPGENYNAFTLEEERDRIANMLQQQGYYYFDRNYIFYVIDSALNNHMLDIHVHIKERLTIGSDSVDQSAKALSRWRIRNVFIQTDYNPLLPPGTVFDTLVFISESRLKDRPPLTYHLLSLNGLRIRPAQVAQSTFLRPNHYYSSMDVQMTRSRFAETGLFSYTNIRFREVRDPDTLGSPGLLDCHIDLGRRKVNAFTVETEGTNNGGRLGVGFNFAYQNYNIFRGSEIFRIKTHFALEVQKAIGQDAGSNVTDLPFFNTIESGIDLSIDFHRFLIPVKQERFPKYFRPKTTIRIGFGLEKRPEYDRTFTTLAFGYEWKESDTKRHQLFPIDWNAIDVRNSADFQELIDNEPNDRVRNQYTDHLIFGMRYSFIFNNQDIRKLKNFIYFRGNLEFAGNLPYLYQSSFGGAQDSTGNYTVIGIRYAQFARADFDIRYYDVITRNTTLVYRLVLGAGMPYGNADVLPLEKGFYAGGANDMRGWRFRELGPGGYSNPEDKFDRMGDLQVEGNLEYRFPVWRFIKMALFADAGNIWLLKENESYPEGDFRFDKFYRELAIDAGLGLRLDFNFFILRVDAATQIRDPGEPADRRWVMNNWQFKDILVNFGIGYPF